MPQVDCFLKLGRIDGAGGPGHEGWIELGSYQFGCSNTALTGKGSSKPTGKPILNDLVVTKEADKSTPKLQLACATGTPFDKATLDVVFASNDPQREGVPTAFLTVELEGVTVTSHQAAGVAGAIPPDDTKPGDKRLTQAVGPYDWETSPDENTIESLALNYVKIKWSYQDAQTGEVVEAGYDLKANKKV